MFFRRLRRGARSRSFSGPAIVGSLDSILDGKCFGWALVENQESPAAVKIAVDGSIVAEGTADEFRRDLLDTGRSTGHCAFVVDLPTEVRDGRFHRVTAMVGEQIFAELKEVQLIAKLTPAQFDQEAPWLDADEQTFERELECRLSSGEFQPELVANLRFFRENGYVCLPGAIPHALIDNVLRDVERAWDARPSHLMVQSSSLGSPTALRQVEQTDGFRRSSFRYLDFHNWSEAGAEIMMHPRVIEFVRAYLGVTPVAMQTLLFENGTQQRAHQDFAYVHSLNPAALAGAWVALEDVHPDAGPLFYYAGSHRQVRKHVFENGTILAEGDGPHIRAFEEYLQAECERLGLERVRLIARKGDVLIWHSALVHGGTARANPSLTRKSMVSHYSTADAYPFDRRNAGARPQVKSRNGATYYALQCDGHREGLFPLD